MVEGDFATLNMKWNPTTHHSPLSPLSTTPLGKTIEILIQQFQLWAGIQISILIDANPCPWVPNHWLSQIRSSMHTYNIQVQHEAWSVPSLHQNNVYIMEAVQELELSNNQLKQVNACHMHLQITTLAKMTDHTSSTISPKCCLAPDIWHQKD